MTSLNEQQRAHFNSIADRYRSARSGDNHLELKRLMWSDFLSDKTDLKRPGISVLDAMCGYADAHGILCEHLGANIDYTGLDYSDEVIAQVRRERPGLNVLHADVTAYAASRTYDLVVVFGGLHHVHHAAADTVTRLAAAIRPGGWFLSLEPTHGNRLFGAVRNAIYRRNTLFDERTERDFSVEELRAVFEGAGLELVDVTYPGLLAYVLYYNPDAFPRLNVGGPRAVRFFHSIDRRLMRTGLGRWLSFATLSLWQKPA
jgi:SAM-dependent methyltransferase